MTDSRSDIAQFFNPTIQVSPMFFNGMGQSNGSEFYRLGRDTYGPDYYGLGQNEGPGTFGPEYYGLERALGGLGQSSVDEGYATEDMAGLGTLEDDKVAAASTALAAINQARTLVREAGRADLAEALNRTALLFQTRLAAAMSRAEVVSLTQWLAGKVSGLVGQSRTGGEVPVVDPPPPSRPARTTAIVAPGEPVTAGPANGNMGFLLLGGLALAAVGIYFMMQEG